MLTENHTAVSQILSPTSLRKIVINSCHDLPASGGPLAFKATFDTIRDRFWWTTMSTDVRTHIEACLSCQRRKSSHRPPRLPVGHRPVTRAFQRVAVDLVEYKSLSQGNRFILSVIDHFTRFVVLIPIKDKSGSHDCSSFDRTRVLGVWPSRNTS